MTNVDKYPDFDDMAMERVILEHRQSVIGAGLRDLGPVGERSVSVVPTELFGGNDFDPIDVVGTISLYGMTLNGDGLVVAEPAFEKTPQNQ